MTNATAETAGPGQVVDFMQPAMREYASLLQDSAGDNLSGLTAYGPVLEASFDTTKMAASSVLVLNRIDLALLRRIAEHGPALGSKHISAPIVMTPDYISGSLDTFPLELLEIHQRRATLAGRDHFADLEIQPEHLRLQCEREFKRILIRLRQGLLAAAGRVMALDELEVGVGMDIVRTARGLVWLRGNRASLGREALVSECERICGGTLNGLRAALELYGDHGMREFDALYFDVETLAKVADAL